MDRRAAIIAALSAFAGQVVAEQKPEKPSARTAGPKSSNGEWTMTASEEMLAFREPTRVLLTLADKKHQCSDGGYCPGIGSLEVHCGDEVVTLSAAEIFAALKGEKQ